MSILDKEYRDRARQNILSVFNHEEEFFSFHMGCEHILVSNHGKIKNSITGNFYKTHKNSNGYDCLNVVYRSGKRMSTLVHRMVADTYLKYFNNDNYIYEVNHIDGDKTNNKITNLEWLTRGENLQHSRDMRLSKSGFHSKFTRQDINDMIELYEVGFKINEIAKAYKGSKTYISSLIRRKARKNE